MLRWMVAWALAAVGAAGCNGDAGGGQDAAVGDGDGDVCTPRDEAEIPDAGECSVAATDFAPCSEDGWDACVSDDGDYHPIGESIGSIARVAAFEEIAGLLFDPKADADADAFLTARLLYQEDEGLDSRVVRRYDPHFDVPPDTDCGVDSVPDQFPDYCVGPARLSPMVLAALSDGFAGIEPRKSAARVEAGLLWFLYVSISKESLTCTDKAKDCDSAYAYYTGGETARGALGLSRYVREVDPYAHDRAWDGLLALRCWRDLDDAESAEDAALRARARKQYDRAVLGGLASVLRVRLELLADAGDVGQRAHHDAFVRTLSPLFDRALRGESAAAADALRNATEGDDIDTAAAIDALSTAFDCP